MDPKKTYSITLADGTVLGGLTKPANAFVAPADTDLSVFENNCALVVISDGENTETHPAMHFTQAPDKDTGEKRFILRDMTQSELKQIEVDSKIEYVAMMAGVEL